MSLICQPISEDIKQHNSKKVETVQQLIVTMTVNRVYRLTVDTPISAFQSKVKTVQRLIVTMTVDRLYMLTVNTTIPAIQSKVETVNGCS